MAASRVEVAVVGVLWVEMDEPLRCAKQSTERTNIIRFPSWSLTKKTNSIFASTQLLCNIMKNNDTALQKPLCTRQLRKVVVSVPTRTTHYPTTRMTHFQTQSRNKIRAVFEGGGRA